MKAEVLTVHWHQDNQPIYSAHFQPGKHEISRLATAGGDNNVRIWKIDNNSSNGTSRVTYLSTLSRHTQAVNVVRFDPKGNLLASAGDDGTILLWSLSDTIKREFGNQDADFDKETWNLRHACRSSASEVYDLAWSPDSQYILAGSMDNIARIYNTTNGQCIRQLAEHQHYVQGVSWDPLNEYIATQSSDRSVHIYKLKTSGGTFSLETPHKISRAELPVKTRNQPPSPLIPSAALASTSLGTSSGSSGTLAPNSGGNSGSSANANTSANISANANANTSNANTAPSTASASSPAPVQTADLAAPPSPAALRTDKSSALMNPPPSRSHSRKSSFSRSDSPSPSLPLPAVKSIGSPQVPPTVMSFSAPSPINSSVHTSNTLLYHNETFSSFFRRLCFTPDGSLLLTPSGIFKYANSESEEISNTVYIYTRAGLNKPPVAHLPGLKKPSLAVNCSPVLYKLREEPRQTPGQTPVQTPVQTRYFDLGSSEPAKTPQPSNSDAGSKAKTVMSPVFSLQYRIIYAVATQDHVIVYDTQQKTPLCIANNLHYATFTDLAWSQDGNSLLMTSTDGFCSMITFEPGELGERYLPSTTAAGSSVGSSVGSGGPANTVGSNSTTPVLANTPLVAPVTNVSTSSSSSYILPPSPIALSKPSASPSASIASLASVPTPSAQSPSLHITDVSSPASDIGGGPPLVPVVSSVPQLAAHGGPSSSGSGSGSSNKNEPERKKRRIVPTFVKRLGSESESDRDQ